MMFHVEQLCGMELSYIAKQINSDYIRSMSVLSGYRRVVVYVEGWDDVSFWAGAFAEFSATQFDIMPPVRDDLSKGKKVVLSFIPNTGRNLLLAVDSDFDWIFDSRDLKQCNWIVQTYAYSIENLQCEPSSLNLVLTKSLKLPSNYDFTTIFKQYSRIIYPLFLWYAWSAFSSNTSVFPLKRFSNAVRLLNLKHFSSLPKALFKLSKLVDRVVSSLNSEYPQYSDEVTSFEDIIRKKGITEDSITYYIQGHTLKDKFVIPLLQTISSELSDAQICAISTSSTSESVKTNQLDYFKNAIVPLKYCLDQNLGYIGTQFYDKISNDISRILTQ